MFPRCIGHTVLRGELVWRGEGGVSAALEVLGNVIGPSSPSLAKRLRHVVGAASHHRRVCIFRAVPLLTCKFLQECT